MYFSAIALNPSASARYERNKTGPNKFLPNRLKEPATVHGLEGGFLIDFPLPLLRFGLGRLGSTRTRSELEDRIFRAITLSVAGRVVAAQQYSTTRHTIFDLQNMIGQPHFSG